MHLSKTSFLQYLQCKKLFWVSTNHPEQIPCLEKQLDALRQQEGRQVESYTHGRYQDATQINRNASLDEILAESREALLRPIFNKPIYNAVLEAQDLIAEIDILLPLEDGSFDLYEIKATTEPKPHHLPDIAFQCHVLTSAGLKITRCFLFTINNEYIRQGEINPKKLFNKNDVSEGAENLSQEIGHQIRLAKEIIGKKECPEIDIGTHCDDPYECVMKSVCWKDVNDCTNNVFTLTRMRKKNALALYNQGIILNADIPADLKLTKRQRIQIETEQTGQSYVSKRGLREFLDGLVYPVYFLDFETINPAIPLLYGTKSFQQIPFQFSLHISDSIDDEPEHFSWIWNGKKDPREELLKRLKAMLKSEGSIIVYNAGFEKAILKKSVERVPEYEEWMKGVLGRFIDLLVPFRNFVVYHPTQCGSASLKSVLPPLTGQSYDHLQIQDGEMAGWMFRRLLESVDDEERGGIREELETY